MIIGIASASKSEFLSYIIIAFLISNKDACIIVTTLGN
jgi:hypothetical protein